MVAHADDLRWVSEERVGDEIRTEISRKFTRQSFVSSLDGTGLELSAWFTDSDSLFASALVRLEDRPLAARIDEPWGSLNWLASAQIGNAEGVTVGRVIIRTGQSNPQHSHTTCEEVLYLLRGRLRHTMGDESAILEAGDTLTVAAGVAHNEYDREGRDHHPDEEAIGDSREQRQAGNSLRDADRERVQEST